MQRQAIREVAKFDTGAKCERNAGRIDRMRSVLFNVMILIRRSK